MHFDNFVTFSPSSQTCYPSNCIHAGFMMGNITPRSEQAMIIVPIFFVSSWACQLHKLNDLSLCTTLLCPLSFAQWNLEKVDIRPYQNSSGFRERLGSKNLFIKYTHSAHPASSSTSG